MNRWGLHVALVFAAGWSPACFKHQSLPASDGQCESDDECAKGIDGDGSNDNRAGSRSVDPQAVVPDPVVPDLVEDARCVNRGEINLDCPATNPIQGACAPRGACCHRSSNYAKEQRLGPDDPLVLEYRVNFSTVTNHPLTVGNRFVAMQFGTTVYEREQQSLLFRFELPRRGGLEHSGIGKLSVGPGRYNCDGTYSFYSGTAAPEPTSDAKVSGAARWQAHETMIEVDVTKHGSERFRPLFATNPNRGYMITPFVDANMFELDWEMIESGFELLAIDVEGEDNRDCLGRRDGLVWASEPESSYVVYVPLEPNANDRIDLIAQSYCQLLVFGVFSEGMRTLHCLNTERCIPDGPDPIAGACEWEKLPDALCPTTDEERANWGCHLGATANPNAEPDYPVDAEIACTQEAPTGPLDADMGAPSSGQCCDPMATSSSLPACNAYRVVRRFVAAAAEITDAQADALQADCR